MNNFKKYLSKFKKYLEYYRDYLITAIVIMLLAGCLSASYFVANAVGDKTATKTVEPTIETTTAPSTESTTKSTEPEVTTVPTTEPTEAETEPEIEEVNYVEEYVEPEYIEETDESETYPTEIEPTEIVPEATEAPTTDEQESDVDSDAVEMLACVIYQEAGGNGCCDDCRRRVADVVLNRVEDPRFPDTIYDVLTAPYQYGEFSWTGIVWPDRAYSSGEAESVDRAYQIAREVLNGQHSELYGQGYVWQAGFIQGYENVYCCGHYFGK